jgi:hypothetical protein
MSKVGGVPLIFALRGFGHCCGKRPKALESQAVVTGRRGAWWHPDKIPSSTRKPMLRQTGLSTTVTLCWLPSGMQVWVEPKPAYQTVNYIEWHIPDVLIQLILLMMNTWVLEKCRDLEKNIYEKKDMCVKLVIYKNQRPVVVWTQLPHSLPFRLALNRSYG